MFKPGKWGSSEPLGFNAQLPPLPREPGEPAVDTETLPENEEQSHFFTAVRTIFKVWLFVLAVLLAGYLIL